MTRSTFVSSLFALALSLALLAVSGCGHSDDHHSPRPATLLVVNDSPYFAIFSIDDCFTYETPWLEPGASILLEVDWTVDNGRLPGTLLPCFYFQSHDGSVEGHASYGPVWVVEGDRQTMIFG